MDTTMFQLRSFVHQRLYAAAEEILGEVEKTITVALYEASRSKEEVESLRHQLDFLRNKPAADPPPTSTTAGRGDECEAPVPQEDPGPSTPEESDFGLSAEVPGPSQTNADLDANSWNYCFVQADFFMPEIKEKQEGLRDDGQTMFFPPPDIVKSEQEQPEAQALYEMQPVSSDDSAAHNESDDSDGFDRKAEQATTLKKKGKTLQGQSGDVNEDKAVLPHDKGSAKGDKGRSLCHFCGKGFRYIGFLMKHLKTHKKHLDCTVCGKTCVSTKRLITHVKRCHKKNPFCNVCGKTFDNVRLLRLHGKIHTGGKEFVCQECGKKFNGRQNLIAHVRTHTREKPYHCDICGKAFSQSQNLTFHKRSHYREKSYQCGLCGKLFKTSGQLKMHTRNHSGEKPYPCDICGKRFSRHGRMTSHRTTHTGERPYGCHVCGMRYRFASILKVHLQTHEKAATAT